MLDTLRKATPEAIDAIKEELQIRKTKSVFLLFAMGSQFDHLIKMQVERLGFFCLVADPASVTEKDIVALSVSGVSVKGIIVSGGPASVYSEPPPFDNKIFALSNIPVLGICLGFQMWAKHVGAQVTPAAKREFGVHDFTYIPCTLFRNCGDNRIQVLESHGDHVEINRAFLTFGSTTNAPVAAAQGAKESHLWGVQFHPEVSDTEFGQQIFSNFCVDICGARDSFPATDIAGEKVFDLQKAIGNKKVLLALSGGSDSSTVAYLLKKAIGRQFEQIRGVYINGIDRPEDEAFVRKHFKDESWLELVIVDGTEQFLRALAGKKTMPEKRVAMREVYKKILELEANEFGASFIAQGTLYTDISESGGGHATGARKARIKLHHNVNLGFRVPELLPLADCVKDSGRAIGRSIGVPEELLVKHPFPGPGLVVRIEGEINEENLAIARQADRIYIEELRKWKLYEAVWQAGAVVTQSVTTCTKGDDAASGVVVALWAVTSVNGFTAQCAQLPYDFLEHVAKRITNEIREVGSVVYRISGKPPATIEWG